MNPRGTDGLQPELPYMELLATGPWNVLPFAGHLDFSVSHRRFRAEGGGGSSFHKRPIASHHRHRHLGLNRASCAHSGLRNVTI